MSIFENYTGNAMLNNALMTIEALGDYKNVSEITPDVLLRLYNDKGLLKINKRLKSYTMLFTKNGPLHNDKANGDKTYDALFKTIINNFENEGDKTCEISGLKFNTTFKTVFEIALKSIGIPKREIQKKDTNLSRTWFPLIGGLGSDAQALPQAKFTIQIHPVCVVILQFLPLSSLLYKGGILLIDSSNFEFAKTFVADNQKELEKRIQVIKSTESIENVRDFSKGSYLLKALKILQEKEEEETYSDLNLWSFSNSGTGASCEIDRIPNSLMQKLINLKRYSPTVRKELEEILSNSQSAFSFLNDLEDNKEWWLLYPNVFGSGKKRTEYNGVSVEFLESYFREIGNTRKIEYARYLSYLINKYKSKSFEKYLSDTSAWNEKDYRIDLYAVLVEAAKNNEWTINHQIQIIDDADQLPIKNVFYKMHKLTHFYYQKKVFSSKLPTLTNIISAAGNVCEWLITLIQKDSNRNKLIRDLTNTQSYSSVSYSGLLLRSYQSYSLNLTAITKALYDENLFLSKNGLNDFLRIFFNQPEQEIFDKIKLYLPEKMSLDSRTVNWFGDIEKFSIEYLNYYFNKYKSKAKTLRLILDIPLESSPFLYWFKDAVDKTNAFLNTENTNTQTRWTDTLLYNPDGEFALSFVKFAIKFSLLKQYQFSYSKQEDTLIS
ncbi:MAG: hypothetical protein Q8K64_14755 [Sediminibacterium sp.]|nr:hypothetical protein [Sediminibacterium sp.]